MNPILAVVIFVASFVVAWIGVALFRRWSLRREIFDIPNERSSHTEPTPRGGGVVIVAVTLAGYLLTTLLTDLPISYGYLAGAVMISLISWLDDLLSLPFWARLAVHVAGSALLMADVGYWHEIFIPTADISIPLGGVLGAVVTMGWLVWLINSYNFMDGIDGIAGIQAVIAGRRMGGSVLLAGPKWDFSVHGHPRLASMGFLVHNWAPARIFMGDVGSAFLGFTLAAIPLLAGKEAPEATFFCPRWLFCSFGTLSSTAFSRFSAVC
jgi:UDP-N-acetylmuramyl pentapeptide phosphotransferase/UDP-N-acetylglucosamine-1-phosphate transferase